jgi:5-methylcytosine-specific restriction protein A
MPSHPCRHPTCTTYVRDRGYCAEHAHLAPLERREQHRIYDLYCRDPESKKFYDSAEWKRAREIKLNANPLCELCARFAEHVHHKIPVKEATREQRLDQRFLVSLCAGCHSKIEAEARKEAEAGA